MIDTFALVLGHGLLAVALLRLMMRDALDTDPLLETVRQEAEGKRKAVGASARNAARKARGKDGDQADGEAARSSSEAVAHKNA